jgi:hypothetical protein
MSVLAVKINRFDWTGSEVAPRGRAIFVAYRTLPTLLDQTYVQAGTNTHRSTLVDLPYLPTYGDNT